MKLNEDGKPRCMNCGNALTQDSFYSFCNIKCWNEWAKDYADSISKEED